MYLSSVVEQQRHSIAVAEVGVDTQQGGVVEDVATVIHISSAHNQQPAHLYRQREPLKPAFFTLCVHRRVCVCVCYLDVGGVEVAQ